MALVPCLSKELEDLQLECSKTELAERKSQQVAYQYRPLESDESFRIMELFPSTNGEEIQMCLHQTTLNTAPAYQTLSYEWGKAGNAERRNIITCDGSMLKITDNLKSALRRIRFPTLRRYIWVDAVCIDQENFEERGRQVAIMEHIYANGHKVLVWLGEAGPYTSQAMDALREAATLAVDRPLHYDEKRYELNNFISRATQRRVAPFPSVEAAIGIKDLFTRTYFERMWIIQEVVHSPRIVVICGIHEIDWMDLYRGSIHSPVCRTMDSPNFLSTVKNIQEVRRSQQRERRPFDLAGLVQCFPRSKATLGRDTIYSLFSLKLSHHRGRRIRMKIRPDYSISDAEAYTDLAMHFLQEGDGLHNFWLMWNCYLPPGMSNVPGKPSWVPDFGNPIRDRPPLADDVIRRLRRWEWVEEEYIGTDGGHWWGKSESKWDYDIPVREPSSPISKQPSAYEAYVIVDGMKALWLKDIIIFGRVLGISNSFSEDDAVSIASSDLVPVDSNDIQSRKEYIDFKTGIVTARSNPVASISDSWQTGQLVQHKTGCEIFNAEGPGLGRRQFPSIVGFGPLGGGLQVGDMLIGHHDFYPEQGRIGHDYEVPVYGLWAVRADTQSKGPNGCPIYSFIGPISKPEGIHETQDFYEIDPICMLLR